MGELPTMAEAVADGTLSFDKAKCVAKSGEGSTEGALVSMAVHATTSQTQRICATWRRVALQDDVSVDDAGTIVDPKPTVIAVTDSDGMDITVRFDHVRGQLVLAAIDSAARQVRRERKTAAPVDPADVNDPTGIPGCDEDRPIERLTQAEWRAEGLLRLAEDFAADTPEGLRPSGFDTTVMVHVGIDTLWGPDMARPAPGSGVAPGIPEATLAPVGHPDPQSRSHPVGDPQSGGNPTGCSHEQGHGRPDPVQDGSRPDWSQRHMQLAEVPDPAGSPPTTGQHTPPPPDDSAGRIGTRWPSSNRPGTRCDETSPAGWHATPGSSPPSKTPTATRCTSARGRTPSPPPCAEPCTPATAPASGPDAAPPPYNSTTPTTAATADTTTSRTSPPNARPTTGPSTSTASRSPENPTASSGTGGQTAPRSWPTPTPTSNPSPTPSQLPPRLTQRRLHLGADPHETARMPRWQGDPLQLHYICDALVTRRDNALQRTHPTGAPDAMAESTGRVGGGPSPDLN